MKIGWMATLAALGLMVLPATAQDERPRERRGRVRMERAGGPGMGGPQAMIEGVARRLARELELDELQQADLREIVADFRDRMAEMSRPSEEQRQLREELRQARANGDEERMRELFEQLREMRSGNMAVVDEFFTEVETILEPNQVEKLAAFREEVTRSMQQRGRRGAEMRRLIEELPEKLKLDEQQRTRFDELIAEMRGQAESRRERWREMRPLMRELREAREAGDEQRVEEIRRELEAMRGEGGPPYEAFFADLEKILRADQKALLAEIRENLGRGQRREAERLNVRTILRAVRRLRVDNDQRTQIQEIVEQAMRQERRLGRGDREAQDQLAREVKQQIVKLLRPEQVERFEESLKGEQPRRGRQPREGEQRGGRRMRRAPDRPEP